MPRPPSNLPDRTCKTCGRNFNMRKNEGPGRYLRRQCCSTACAGGYRCTHGLSSSPEYRIWWSMLKRCTLPSDSAFHKYGALGISVCERWQTFENFFSDMGSRPTGDHSIDRIDGTGDYTPNNCRWATRHQQQNNIKNNRRLTVNGVTMTVSEWDRKTGYRRGVIASRLRLGWTADQAILTTPRRRLSA